MDRHAQAGEDARMTQLRLYQEAQGLPVTRTCSLCRREGRAWSFEAMSGYRQGFRCRNGGACTRRLMSRLIR